MFKVIVVGHDGSDGARRALERAVELGRAAGGARIVVALIEQEIVGKGGSPVPIAAEELEADVRREVEAHAADGLEVTFDRHSSVLGGPAPALVDVAHEAGADVIVVGTRGRTMLAGLLVGSTAQRLLHVSDLPVLVIPEKAAR
jgi:nucleotide-binding universal stress UspA family protein